MWWLLFITFSFKFISHICFDEMVFFIIETSHLILNAIYLNADKYYLALIICCQKSDTYYRKSDNCSRTLDICNQIDNTCSRKLNRHYLINFTANPDSYICSPKFNIYNRINNTESLAAFFLSKIHQSKVSINLSWNIFPKRNLSQHKNNSKRTNQCCQNDDRQRNEWMCHGPKYIVAKENANYNDMNQIDTIAVIADGLLQSR